jgi:hypothetical protein
MAEDRKNNLEKYRAKDNAHSKKHRERNRLYAKEYQRTHFKQYLVAAAKRRAQAKNLEFSITADDIQFYILCPYLRIPLVYGSVGGATDNSASLDRIDNTKGYTPENIEIISWKANRIKSDATLAELQLIVDRMGT